MMKYNLYAAALSTQDMAVVQEWQVLAVKNILIILCWKGRTDVRHEKRLCGKLLCRSFLSECVSILLV